jgi:uncharacterized repeat protein (TIGR01451 family)
MQSLPCPSPALLNWYPDEYICDGGDGGIRVRVEDNWTVHHLEPEDTVGHFDTLDGRVLVTESNRICIYAPRFAAVRKVTGPLQNESRRHVAEAGLPDSALTERAMTGSVNLTQRLAAQRHLLVQPALALRDPLPAGELDNAEGLVQAIKNLSAHEDFRVIRWGVHKQAEKPLLAEFTQAAIAWSHDSAVQVLLERQEAIAEVTIPDVETTYQLDQPGTPRLRVIKTASTGDALPGEIVEFTIRFDSIGHQVIGNVTIMDSLTTRLEYVADSAQCSRPAHFASEENESGSLVLRWELDAPMEPGEGGIIRFRCRVR